MKNSVIKRHGNNTTLENYNKSLLKKLIGLKLTTLLISLAGLLITVVLFEVDIAFEKLKWVFLFGVSCLIFSGSRFFIALPLWRYEPFFALATDILFISLIVLFTGGTSNPFSSSILVPLAVAVAILPKNQSLILVICSIIAYGLWTFNMDEHAHHHTSFELHLYGMWINFCVSAVLLYIFIAYAMTQLKQNELLLRNAREKILKDEQLVGIATLTASTAHSLGTPLSTMSILLEDVKTGEELNESDLGLLKKQIMVCKSYLNGLVNAVKKGKVVDYSHIPVEDLLNQLREHINLLFPIASVSFAAKKGLALKRIPFSQTLFFAIANLIDNAIQSAENQVTIELYGDSKLIMKIIDDGPGITKDVMENLGQPFISSKSEGLGVGIFLTNSTIEQAGGTLSIMSNPEGGSIVELRIPFSDES